MKPYIFAKGILLPNISSCPLSVPNDQDSNLKEWQPTKDVCDKLAKAFFKKPYEVTIMSFNPVRNSCHEKEHLVDAKEEEYGMQ
jgi:hypothetical protein